MPAHAMFRMIFITLVALFGALAVFGIDQPPQARIPAPRSDWIHAGTPARLAGLPPQAARQAPAAMPAAMIAPPSGTPLVVEPGPATLRATPQAEAEVLHLLTMGARLWSLGEMRDGFLRVRDARGATGFVPRHLVAADQPI